MGSTTSAAIIEKLRVHFSREGIPQKLRTDNDTRFMSEEFQSYLKKMDISHSTSSPIYPKANGHVEKAVDIVKRIMTKAADSKTDPLLGLLEYRNMPVDGFRSPSQLLKGRHLRSILPCVVKHLTPKTVSPAELRKVRTIEKQRQSCFYNKTAVNLPPLKPQQMVWVQLEERGDWEKATVKTIHDSRSYWITTEDGAEYRRNRVNLRPRYASIPAVTPAHHGQQVSSTPPQPVSPETREGSAKAPAPVAVKTPAPLRSSTRVIKKRDILDL